MAGANSLIVWPPYSCAFIGDSQSDYGNTYTRAGRLWGPQLEEALTHLGALVGVRGYGKSGDTSTQALARAHTMFRHKPDLAVIYIGVNDPGAAIATATTEANIQAMVKALKHGAIGSTVLGYPRGPVSVANVAALPNTGRPRQRYVVLSDTDTTGGIAPDPYQLAQGLQAPTITGSVPADANGQQQSVWEYRYPVAGANGWGRVAVATTAPTFCQRIIIVSTNYLNFTVGGDTPATPYASYAPVRAAQQGAASIENVNISGVPSVIYADLYGFQRTMIVGGTKYGITFPAQTVPNFSADTSIVPSASYDATRDWHYQQNNQHHNEFGNAIVAQCLAAAIRTQAAAWVTALSS